MKIFLNILAVILCSMILAVIMVRFANRRRKKSKARAKPKPKAETTKSVIWVCLANGFAWVWCSYVLAYLDKMQIAESLSQVAVTEIIGVVLAYCIKSAVENLSRNNHWPDKPSDTGEPPDQ